MPHLGVLGGREGVLAVHHAEGDALGLGGEHPGDGGPVLGPHRAHRDGDHAVAAGADEQLPGRRPEARDVLQGVGGREPAGGGGGLIGYVCGYGSDWLPLAFVRLSFAFERCIGFKIMSSTFSYVMFALSGWYDNKNGNK